MTLILSCITDKQAFQVSDRRLTRINPDGSPEVAEDDRNKAVAFDGRLSWAFTGLANIGQEPSALWLAKRLKATSRESLSELGAELAQHATEDFKRIRVSSTLKRHTFVAVGWWPTSEPHEVEPVIVRISNALDSTGGWQSTASDTFVATLSNVQGGMTLFPSGQPVPEDRLLRLRRNLRASLRRGALHASGDLLVREVRDIASTNKSVGSSVMLVSLPKAALDKSGNFTFINQRPSEKVATYWYFSLSNDAQKSPIVVGESMITSVVVHRGEAARRGMKRAKLASPTRPRFLILTPWAGTDTDGDARRGLVAEYKLNNYTDLTRALSWDKAYDCPYFGVIIGMDAEEVTIEEVKADERHVILADRQLSCPKECPSEQLITQLKRWFIQRGATRDDLVLIDLGGHRETLRGLIDRLLIVMRTPRRGREGTKLHQPPRGTGAGVAVQRKYHPDRSSEKLPKDF